MQNIGAMTILIPAFNEETGIRRTLEELIPVAKINNWEIVVIDDGSTDNTAEILTGFSGINIVKHPYNKGYGASLKTGIYYSKTDLIAFYDADGQHRPNDLKKLYENFDNFDMLVGQRGKDSHKEFIRKPGKWILVKIANFLTERNIPDLNSGLRIVKRDVITRMLHLFPEGFSFSTTSTIAFFNMGYTVGYYPIVTNKRIGNSTVKQLKHGSSTLLLILRLIILFNPLKVFIPTSVVFFLIGVIYELYAGILLQPDHPRLISGAFFLILTGILIFFFGLVVDQISEMRKHLNRV